MKVWCNTRFFCCVSKRVQWCVHPSQSFTAEGNFAPVQHNTSQCLCPFDKTTIQTHHLQYNLLHLLALYSCTC
jgi:hypothetical protein